MRREPWFAAIWLFFLLDPLMAAWDRRGSVSGVAGMVLTVAFGAVYMAMWLRMRNARWRFHSRPTLPVALAWFLSLGGLGTLMILTMGKVGTAAAVYCAVTAVMLFPSVWAAAITASI